MDDYDDERPPRVVRVRPRNARWPRGGYYKYFVFLFYFWRIPAMRGFPLISQLEASLREDVFPR